MGGRPLPKTKKWLPRDASQTFSAIFSAECGGAESRLLYELLHEKKFAIDNFDSGVPFEGLVRNELRRLLPGRYNVSASAAHILDKNGKTAGNCDVVIYNSQWFSPLKSPKAENAGNAYLPIESVYAIGEIKQTLSESTLDAAMEKLVKCLRLERPPTYANRLVENREGSSCFHGLTNPLYTFILAGGLEEGQVLQGLIERFYDICKDLKRLEMPRALCVLGAGTVTWAFYDPMNDYEVRPALFVKGDLFHPIVPAFSPASERSSLFFLIQSLQLSLFHTILGPEDIAATYGYRSTGIQLPSSADIMVLPDQEWLDRLNEPCKSRHDE